MTTTKTLYELRDDDSFERHDYELPAAADEIQEHIRKLNEELRTKPVGSKSREDREIAKDRWMRLLRASKEGRQ